MSRSGSPRPPADSDSPYRGIAGARYGRYVVALAAILLVAFTIHVALNSHKGATSIHPGARIPPFAAPYALGGPPGEVDVATHANDGQAGKVAACSERGPRILNICQLYERGPVVLALFFQAGSCTRVLDELQLLAQSFPQVGFAAVAVKEGASSVARVVRAKHVTVPVGVDGEGRLGELFSMVSCPQITFVYPGGVVQSAALLNTQSLATLRTRVAQLLAASRARGWRPGRT
ncbi:MAG TPA: hypothetical protein VIJ39_02775 [Solirubrobacteraceae bacterium]